ncbi:17418_t:CDS:2 [Cetraspora pellucida]|uniref:17418_t:CDS:1 n=1 Tax=Cetraspora pellucida TaxID=1433469 RepID=A0A9N9CG14_9GLOM|nr:17418_t:CDS:2 [Cetraspora pellucida]
MHIKYTLLEIILQNYKVINEYKSNKEETNKGHKITETDNKNDNQIDHILIKYVDIFREKQEYATRINTKEILLIELNLKGEIRESEMLIRKKTTAMQIQ